MADYGIPYDEDEYEDLEENEFCDYGWGICIDPDARDRGECYGCDLMIEATEAATKENEPREE